MAETKNETEPGPRRGRPHDAEGAREAILNAAEEVFAQHGFDGARIDAIAAAAGYNKSLIFQYFGDKLGLYTSVLRRADDQTRELQADAMSLIAADRTFFQPDKLRQLLKSFMGRLFDFFQEHPRMVRMFLWEMAEGWQTYAKIVPELGAEDIEEYGPFLTQIRDAGLLRSDFDPLVQVVVAEFVLMQYLVSVPLYQTFTQGQELASAEALAQAREFLTEFIASGLVPDRSKPASKGD